MQNTLTTFCGWSSFLSLLIVLILCLHPLQMSWFIVVLKKMSGGADEGMDAWWYRGTGNLLSFFLSHCSLFMPQRSLAPWSDSVSCGISTFFQVFLTIHSQINAFPRRDLELCTIWDLYQCTATEDDIHSRPCQRSCALNHHTTKTKQTLMKRNRFSKNLGVAMAILFFIHLCCL